MVLVALLDASVLFPALLRDTLLRVAACGLYRPLWSEDIFAELRRALLSTYRDQPPDVDRLLERMGNAFPDSMVEGYESLIPTLALPDPEDRHVVAAALRGGAAVIVTANLDDFSDDVLMPLGLEAQSPDAFLLERLDEDPDGVLEALQDQVGGYSSPPQAIPELLDVLAARHGLVDFVANARRYLRRP